REFPGRERRRDRGHVVRASGHSLGCHPHASRFPSIRASSLRARWRRDLTVPSATWRIAATSPMVRPSTSAKTRVVRNSSEKAARAVVRSGRNATAERAESTRREGGSYTFGRRCDERRSIRHNSSYQQFATPRFIDL